MVQHGVLCIILAPPPPISQAVPPQEPGVRPARALPYELHATGRADVAEGRVTIQFANPGALAAVFQVRAGASQDGPWTYTVGARGQLTDAWSFAADCDAPYDLSVHGPNGFFRALQGKLGRGRANLVVETIYEPVLNAITLEIRNLGARLDRLHIANAYSRDRVVRRVEPGERFALRFPLHSSSGWYDFTLTSDSDAGFAQRIAGHLETGAPSTSDPALGG
jgi:phospholipase C